MGSQAEFIEAWQRLDLRHLEVIAKIGRSPQLAKTSVPLQHFIARSLNSEADHREHFATKADQKPDFDDWSDGELADAYFGCLLVERAVEGTDERLSEFAALLRLCVCTEMAERLTAMQMAKDLHDV